jgi:biotin transport system substrate-specific component
LQRLTTADISRSALFTALIVVGAFVAVPIGPVPFTLQVFGVLLAAMLMGPRLALLSVVAYLALGLIAPVYAGGASGLGALVGPTGGYLAGFIPAVVITGTLARGGSPSAPRLLAAGMLGLVPIYLAGTVWLAWQLDLTWEAAVSAGVLPFVAMDVLKAMLAATVARGLVSLPLGLLAPQRDR